MTKYLTAAGITKVVSPHSFRHTFATMKAEHGISPYKLRARLGHARLDTARIDVHLAEANGQKRMEATSLCGRTASPDRRELSTVAT